MELGPDSRPNVVHKGHTRLVEPEPRVKVTKKSHPQLGVILHAENYGKPTPNAKVNNTSQTIPSIPVKVASKHKKGHNSINMAPIELKTAEMDTTGMNHEKDKNLKKSPY